MHRDGRATLAGAAISFHDCPRKRYGIDADMPVKPAVFFQKKCFDDVRGNLNEWCPQAVLLVGRECDAKQFAVRGPDGGGERNTLGQGRVWPETEEEKDYQKKSETSTQTAGGNFEIGQDMEMALRGVVSSGSVTLSPELAAALAKVVPLTHQPNWSFLPCLLRCSVVVVAACGGQCCVHDEARRSLLYFDCLAASLTVDCRL